METIPARFGVILFNVFRDLFWPNRPTIGYLCA